MKRLLLFISTLICANVLMSQTRFSIDGLRYEVKSTNPAKVEVYDANSSIITAIIPAIVTYYGIDYSVTSIGRWAFDDCNSLASVTIPNSVTSIGFEAFLYCDSLASVTFEDNSSLDSIGGEAFCHCSSLTSVTIPNSVTFIGGRAFWGCSSLTSIDIPNSVNTIGADAFRDCDNLTSVTIGNGVPSIGADAFWGCSSLTSITIPNSVTSIGRFAFYNCSSLASVTFEDNSSLDSIEYDAFQNCSSLTSITIPNSVTYIGHDVFSGCSSLTSVTIPNSVTYIGHDAFRNCSSLTSVTIPNSVTFVGYSAFDGCISLTSMTVECTNIPYLSNIGLDSILQNLTIGENVTSIERIAFSDYSSLQNVTCLATTPPTLEDNDVFPRYHNTATLTVPCGTLEAYSTSYWNTSFAGRISENGYDVVATANDDLFGSVAVANDCSSATLTATANYGYSFLNWNDGSTENPRIVNLTSDTSFVANFIVSNVNTDITATICQGQTYTENNFNVSEAGTYTQTLTASNGADSVVTLTLNVNPTFNTELSATICQGQVYTENNFNISEAGVYTQTLTSANGCDSIVTLTLNVNPTFDTTINATINAGETYAEFGFNESEAGTYVQNLQTEFGCDSTITLVLSVNSSLLEAEAESISFFPNPTKSEITFSQAIEKVEIIDLTGKTIFTFTNAKTINIESLPAGAYYLRLTNEEKTSLQKVIKQ